MNKKQYLAALILNIFIFVAEVVSVTLAFVLNSFDNFQANWTSILYFTVLSNAVLGASALAMIINISVCYKTKRFILNRHVYLFKFSAVVGVMFTFIIVMAVLHPYVSTHEEYKNIRLFKYEQSFLHFVMPLTGFFTFVFCEYAKTDKRWSFALSYIEGVLYLVLITPFIFTGAYKEFSPAHYEAPYPFLNFLTNPWWQSILWVLLLTVVYFGVGAGVYFSNYGAFNRLFVHHHKKQNTKNIKK